MLFQNLKNFFLNIPSRYILLFIVTVGFLLRIVNLTIGFPILYMSADEASYHISALVMLAEKMPFTTGNYGPLGAYLQIPFIALSASVLYLTHQIGSFEELKVLVVSHEGYFMFIPRVISALFGTLTILATYRLTREIFGKKEIALLASLFCALSLNLVFISHQARALSPAIFFEIVAIHFSVLAVKRQADFSKYITWAAVFSATSFGFHQFGGLSMVLVLLITRNTKMPFMRYLKKIILPVTIFSVLIFILNYFSLGSRFFSILNPGSTDSNVGLVRYNFLTNLSITHIFNFLSKLFLSDPVIVFLFTIFLVAKKFRAKFYTPFKMFTIANLFLSLFVFPPFIRYFLMAFSLFPIFAGKVLYDLIWHKRYKYLMLAMVVIVTSFNSLYFDSLLLGKDTFSEMREWVRENISPRTPIVATGYRNIGYVPVASASEVVRQKKKGYYLKAAKLIDDKYVPNTRFIIYANEVADAGMTKSQATQKAIALSGAKIIIDSYLAGSDRLAKSREESDFEILAHFSPTGDKIYSDLLPEFYSDPVFLFPFFKIERPGPYYDILLVK